jgi:hypothetical protein
MTKQSSHKSIPWHTSHPPDSFSRSLACKELSGSEHAVLLLVIGT